MYIYSPHIDIIIVNWNSGSQLFEAVASIAEYHHGLVESVIIIDNASCDDSLSQLEALSNLPFQLKIVCNIENLGFGVACNLGASMAEGDYLLFMNPDARLLENSLLAPLKYFYDKKNKDVGIIGIQLLDNENRVTRSCARFPTLTLFLAHSLGLNRIPGLGHFSIHMKDWDHNETRIVDHVIGAYYFIPRLLFNSLGGFDKNFFVYLEDLDLSLRAYKAGYRSLYLKEAQAFHAGGGTSRQVKAHRLFYSLRSQIIYGFKHFHPCHALALLLILLSFEFLTRSLFSFIYGGFDSLFNTWRAYGMLWRDIPNFLKIKLN